jgi:uncharacterized phage protein (TIGR02220 family)
MKYTVFGFSQAKLIEFGLDVSDALLLRYFVDFQESGNMHEEKVNGKTYYWVNYKNIILDIPIIALKKDSIYRRFIKMTKLGILEHATIKCKGTYSYYKLGTNYINLIYSMNKDPSPLGYKSNLGDEINPDPLEYESQPGNEMNPYPLGYESQPDDEMNPYPLGDESQSLKDKNPEQSINLLKDSSTKDSSTKDPSTKDSSTKKHIHDDVVDYLNQKCGTSYKSTTQKTQKLINSRQKEGFTLEDFYKVIDNKAKDWLKKDMEQYLRPITLFGTNFESYLNQNNRREKENAGNEKNSGEITESEFGFTV